LVCTAISYRCFLRFFQRFTRLYTNIREHTEPRFMAMTDSYSVIISFNYKNIESMVKGFSCQNPLTLDERLVIQENLSVGLSYRLIGLQLGRCKSVVRREAKRLGSRDNYNAEKAQAHFEYVQYNHGFRVWQRNRSKNSRIK
jgi:helix-turn-helix protein